MDEARQVLPKQEIFRISLIILPFVPYLGLPGLLAVTVISFKEHYNSISRSLLGKATLLISVLIFTNCFTAYNKAEAFLQLANFLPFFLLFLALPFLLKTLVQLEQLAIDLILSSVPISLIEITQFSLGSVRPSAIFDNPNVLASYLVVILGIELGLFLVLLNPDSCFSLNLFFKEIKFKSRYVIFPLALSSSLTLVAILISGSRNGLIAALLQLVAFIISFSYFIRRSFAISGISLAILVTLVTLAWTWFDASRRLTLSSLTSDLRIEIWQVALSLIQEKPLFGWGLGSFKFLYPLRSTTLENFAHAHNFWLCLGVEAGILVTIGLTALVGYICYTGAKELIVVRQHSSVKFLLFGYLAAFGGCVFYALFDCTFYDARVNTVNWLVLGCIYQFTKHESSFEKS